VALFVILPLSSARVLYTATVSSDANTSFVIAKPGEKVIFVFEVKLFYGDYTIPHTETKPFSEAQYDEFKAWVDAF
jgi:hypothetical protein